MYRKYWATRGRSKPSWCATLAISAGLACGPMYCAAGLEGMTRARKNVMTDTPSSTTMVLDSRVMTNSALCISPCRAAGSDQAVRDIP